MHDCSHHRVMKNKDLKASITHSLFHYHICQLKRKKKKKLWTLRRVANNLQSDPHLGSQLLVAYTHNKHGQGRKIKMPHNRKRLQKQRNYTQRTNARKPTGDVETRAHMLQRCWKSTLLKVVYWPLDLSGHDEPQSTGPSGFGVRGEFVRSHTRTERGRNTQPSPSKNHMRAALSSSR